MDPGESASGEKQKYTVPAIHHLPTNTYMMDSGPIAQFLDSTYPSPSVQLTSDLGREIEAKARGVVGKTFRVSLTPREVNVLSPRAQEFFRRTREAALGHPLEDLLEKEEKVWSAMEDEIGSAGELMRTNKVDGPFVLGDRASYTDFFIAGSLQCARVVHEATFHRIVKHPGYRDVYEACSPYMEKDD